MTKTIRECLEDLAHKSNNRGLSKLGESHTDIDQALASIRAAVEGKKKRFDSQAGSTEESDKNVNIYNRAIEDILKLLE